MFFYPLFDCGIFTFYLALESITTNYKLMGSFVIGRLWGVKLHCPKLPAVIWITVIRGKQNGVHYSK